MSDAERRKLVNDVLEQVLFMTTAELNRLSLGVRSELSWREFEHTKGEPREEL